MAYIGNPPIDARSFGSTKFEFTATAGQTAFTGTDDNNKTLSFTEGHIEVYVNGVLMDNSDFSTSGGNTVTLAAAAAVNDIISVIAIKVNVPRTDYVPAAGGTFTGAVTVEGNLTVEGTTTTIDSANAQTVNLGDNDKIQLGDGDDLQIYHDGSNSYVDDAGTGRLYLRGNDRVQIQKYTGDDMITAIADGAVKLYYDNSKKFETTSSGVDVTGTLTSSDSLVVGASSTATVFEATGSKNDQWAGKFTNTNSGGFGVLAITAGSTADEKAFEVRKNTSDTALLVNGLGNVGLGVTPTDTLHIKDQAPIIKLESSDASLTSDQVLGGIQWRSNDPSGIGVNDVGQIALRSDSSSGGSYYMQFNVSSSSSANYEACRIDNTGNLLVGKNSVSGSGTGHVLRQTDSAIFTRNSSNSSSETVQISRHESDGIAIRINTGANQRAGIGVLHGDGMYFTTGSGNTERLRITSTGYIEAASASQVRLTLGSQGTAGTNTANWIRGNGTELGFNSASGGYGFEIGGTSVATISSSGNLGIGTTNPIADLSIVDASTGTGMEFQAEVVTGTNRLTNFDRVESAYKKFRLDASEIALFNSGTRKATIDNDGLKFNSDTSSDNALNDYEQGVWNITDGSGAALTSSYSVSSGTNVYTKIGRLVIASVNVQWPSTANTGLARIVLPFTASPNGSCVGGVVIEDNYSSSHTLTAAINYSNGVIFRTNGVNALTNANLSGKRVRFTLTYHH